VNFLFSDGTVSGGTYACFLSLHFVVPFLVYCGLVVYFCDEIWSVKPGFFDVSVQWALN